MEEPGNTTKAAVRAFLDGMNCTQAILASFTGDALVRRAALRMAAPLGGGLANTGGVCGAVTGGLMVLGLRLDGEDPQALQEDGVVWGREFLRRFEDRFGTRNCRDLLACDISTADGLQRAMDEKLFTRGCPVFVRGSAEILTELLAEMDREATPQQSG